MNFQNSLVIFLFLTNFIYVFSEDLNNHQNWKYLPILNCGGGGSTLRIVGGSRASLGQFPWMARLGYDIPSNGTTDLEFLCAGALLSSHYVLTAAHCTFGKTPESKIKVVRLGENNLDENDDEAGYLFAIPIQDLPVRKVLRHEDYKTNSIQGDIALIRLAIPATYNDFVSPICLPIGDILKQPEIYQKINTSVTVAGWGIANPKTKEYPDSLLFVKLLIKHLSSCDFISAKDTSKLDEAVICAGDEARGRDTCLGDSGAPAMKVLELENTPPKYYLMGIVSYGMNDCGKFPAFYTNVTHYMKWVLDRIEE